MCVQTPLLKSLLTLFVAKKKKRKEEEKTGVLDTQPTDSLIFFIKILCFQPTLENVRSELAAHVQCAGGAAAEVGAES